MSKLDKTVLEILDEKKCNPFEILADLALGNVYRDDFKLTISPRLRLEASAELAQYITPKLKSIDFAGLKDRDVQVMINLVPKQQTEQKDEK